MFARTIRTFLMIVLAASAAPPLTTIQDVLYKADGTRFTGMLQISWKSFETPDTSNITTHSLAIRVVNGALRVQLAPNSAATPRAYYAVKYNSDGKVQFEETWAVPPSAQALRVRDVRVVAQSLTGNETAGPVQESDVVGLLADLAARPVKSAAYAAGRAVFVNPQGALESVSGSAFDCVRVDGSSGPCGGGGEAGSFVDAETPAGVVDGSNPSFTVLTAPSPASSLAVYRNGLLMKPGFDYTANGRTVSFVSGAVPQAGDTLLAVYRVAGAGGTQYPGPQVLCGGIGAATNLGTDTSLGACTIPGGLLAPGDRVEVRFALEHTGSASGFHFDVKWGSGFAMQRDAAAADALVSGRVEAGVLADAAQLSGLSWGTALPMAGSVSTAPDSGTGGVTIEFLGRMTAAGGDTLALKNYTVVRFP